MCYMVEFKDTWEHASASNKPHELTGTNNSKHIYDCRHNNYKWWQNTSNLYLDGFFALPIPTVLVYRINKSTLTYEVYSEGYKIV